MSKNISLQASKITKGMILAAGLGTRLRPITNDVPKPMIDVGDRKIIEYKGIMRLWPKY